MKNFLLMLILLASTQVYGQHTACASKDITPIKPAPCSIEASSQANDVWLIQVGVYKRPIEARPGTFVMYLTDGNEGFYVYYILQFFTMQSAQDSVEAYKDLGFCDAYAVLSPITMLFFN
jgi:hypothetical protein